MQGGRPGAANAKIDSRAGGEDLDGLLAPVRGVSPVLRWRSAVDFYVLITSGTLRATACVGIHGFSLIFRGVHPFK
jgi:hypothetical protein